MQRDCQPFINTFFFFTRWTATSHSLNPLHIKTHISSLNASWRALRPVLRMIICTPVLHSLPEPATGWVIEVEGDPVSCDVCSARRGTALHTVRIMERAPLANGAYGRGGLLALAGKESHTEAGHMCAYDCTVTPHWTTERIMWCDFIYRRHAVNFNVYNTEYTYYVNYTVCN